MKYDIFKSGVFMKSIVRFLVSCLLCLAAPQVLLSAENEPKFTIQQRVAFFDQAIKSQCKIPDDKKSQWVLENEKCLVLDQESIQTKKPLIIKLSCKSDVVRAPLVKYAKDFCIEDNNQNLIGQKKQQEDNIKNATSVAAAQFAEQNRLAEVAKKEAEAKANLAKSAAGVLGAGKITAGPTASFGGGGVCVGPGPCDDNAAPRPVTYSWCQPNRMMYGSDCYFDHNSFEPSGGCSDKNIGQSMSFGDRTVTCMPSNATQEALDEQIKKNKSLDPKSLGKVVPIPKRAYGYVVIKKVPVEGICISNGGAKACERATLGNEFTECGYTNKCARLDSAQPPAGMYDYDAKRAVAFTAEDDAKVDAEREKKYQDDLAAAKKYNESLSKDAK